MTADPTETDGTLDGDFVLTMDAGGAIGAAQVWRRNGPDRILLASVQGVDGIQLFDIPVLDGTSESRECPTNHCSTKYFSTYGLILPTKGLRWTTDFCPDCGIRLGEAE
jgi:hypothetical protein